jgi:hypothetical protein
MKRENMQTIEMKNKPQINADERRFIESGIQRIFVDNIDSNLINSPQRAQSSQRFFTNTFNPCVSVSSVQSVFYYIPYCIASVSTFIMPKPCGFSTPRTRMPAGIRGHALQRRDSGRFHLRLIISNQKSEIT